MQVAVLQLPSIGLSSTKLYRYIRIAHSKNIKLLVLGEYLLNSFFKELESMPVEMIHEQSLHQIEVLRELSAKYDLVIVAPLILVKKRKPYKAIVKFSPNSVAYYYQQVLIGYVHWNEKRFFANENARLDAPLIFTLEGMRFAVMGGFELHVDRLWTLASKKNIDMVILPSVSTFESAGRWRELAKMRAFTHNCYVLRANRIGEYKKDDEVWKFYGDSFLIDPNGEVENTLGNSEELMICNVEHAEVLEARRTWGFKELNAKDWEAGC
jgi:nitrilase